MDYYLAVDIGASSGRHIVGWMEGDELKTEEVYRFPNGVKELDGHIYFDVDEGDSDVAMKIFERREDAELYREGRRTRDGKYWDELREVEVR